MPKLRLHLMEALLSEERHINMAFQSSRFISLVTSQPNRGIVTNIRTWVKRMVLENKPIPKIGLYISMLGIMMSVFLDPSLIEASPSPASDSTLVRKFAPIFVLTKNPERLGRKVLNPEPVEIIGANSISNVWLKLQSVSRGDLVRNAPFSDWYDLSTLREIAGSASFLAQTVPLENKFAFLRNAGWYFTPGPELTPGHYGAHAYFDYPGDDEKSWNRAYFSGTGENNPHAGWRFRNTVYARVFERSNPSDGYGPVVIKYWLFFPYNDWQNNHERDWQTVNVMVTNRDPSLAEFYGIDYMFHGKSITYYDITDSLSTIDIRKRVSPVGGTFPVLYVSAGGHGLYPTPGDYSGAGGATYDDNLTSNGVVLHPDIADNIEIAQSYDLVMLPNPDPLNTDNMGLSPEMSWLGAKIFFGTPAVGSPFVWLGKIPIPLIDVLAKFFELTESNKAAISPFHKN